MYTAQTDLRIERANAEADMYRAEKERDELLEKISKLEDQVKRGGGA